MSALPLTAEAKAVAEPKVIATLVEFIQLDIGINPVSAPRTDYMSDRNIFEVFMCDEQITSYVDHDEEGNSLPGFHVEPAGVLLEFDPSEAIKWIDEEVWPKAVEAQKAFSDKWSNAARQALQAQLGGDSGAAFAILANLIADAGYESEYGEYDSQHWVILQKFTETVRKTIQSAEGKTEVRLYGE